MLRSIRFGSIWTFAWVFCVPFSVSGQACCSSGAPIVSNLSMYNWQGTGLSMRLVYDYNYQNDLVSGTKRLDDRSRARSTSTIMYRGAYTFNHRFSVIGLFPWIWQLERNARQGRTFDSRANGLGDIIFLARYQLIQRTNQGLAISAGVKTATGRTDRTNPETQLPLPPDLQPGTGSWDGLFVLQFDQKIGTRLWGHIFGSYRLTGPNDRFAGQIRYEFGNETQLFVGTSLPFALQKITPRPFLYLRYRHTMEDLTNGEITPNTGGHWLHLVPQFQLDIGSSWGLDARAEIPVYRNLKGTQLTTTYSLRFAVFYRINNQARPLNEF